MHVCQYNVNACLPIQSNPPAELLLGTDLQQHLGFHLVDLANSPQPPISSDLEVLPETISTEQPPIPESEPVREEEDGLSHQQTPVSVCLLQATKIPARHAKVVAIGAQYDSKEDDTDVLLFEPANKLQELTGLVLEEGVLHTAWKGLSNHYHKSISSPNPP